MKSVRTIGGSESRGEAVVVVKKILHQSANIFQKSSDSSEILGNVNFPLYCHWKKGVKHGYLYTGNLKGGEGPVVQCRIKFGLWRRLYHKNICDSIIRQTWLWWSRTLWYQHSRIPTRNVFIYHTDANYCTGANSDVNIVALLYPTFWNLQCPGYEVAFYGELHLSLYNI